MTNMEERAADAADSIAKSIAETEKAYDNYEQFIQNKASEVSTYLSATQTATRALDTAMSNMSTQLTTASNTGTPTPEDENYIEPGVYNTATMSRVVEQYQGKAITYDPKSGDYWVNFGGTTPNWVYTSVANAEKAIDAWIANGKVRDTALMKPVRRFEHGFEGVINQPTLALIGERGPEQVSVQPIGKSSGGGVTHNWNINVSTGPVSGLSGAEELADIIYDKISRKVRTEMRGNSFFTRNV